MHVVSVNIGLPRSVNWRGKEFQTGIFKDSVAGQINVEFLNLQGDRQADLTVHGGPDKSVYAYPIEHYIFWKEFLGNADLPFGALGENLTTQGLTEDIVHIGDHLRIGTAEFVVTQPRVPCFKLAARHQNVDIVKEFFKSGRSGFYLRVTKEGHLEAGDKIEILSREDAKVQVAEISKIQRGEAEDIDLIRRACNVEALAPGIKASLRDLLENLTS